MVTSVSKVKQEEWDACAKGGGEVNPFTLWAFLDLLERSGSAAPEQGWMPQHVLVRVRGWAAVGEGGVG